MYGPGASALVEPARPAYPRLGDGRRTRSAAHAAGPGAARASETGEQVGVESQPYVADTPPGEFPRPAGGPEVIIVQHDREEVEDDVDEMDD